ncbi:expressed unknown protein [Seminavis robusta]|uniref:Uncharacterized protein n=1 Tax=Seminavis robusta TaxID=568900 RepID=A0A9N8EJE4_9STRA|nr:expressed unknown protein [Seminavis robusta]|eukprot:Sro1275_g258490.1 n/a (145) ;mRNA; r:20506-20940
MAMQSFLSLLVLPEMEVSIKEDNHQGHCKPSACPAADCKIHNPRALAYNRWLPSEDQVSMKTKCSTLPPSPPRRRRNPPGSRWSEQPSDNDNKTPLRRRKSMPPTKPKRRQGPRERDITRKAFIAPELWSREAACTHQPTALAA